jgi:phosphoglucomutase/phosphomannomutase
MDEAERALEAVAKAERDAKLSSAAAVQIRRWLREPPFAVYRPALLADIAAGRWPALDDAFYKVLEFGTGGRRGRMYPVGTNVLNQRTIAESARGLADYVTSRKGEGAPRSCVIARDTRHNSPEFEALCARVLAAAGSRDCVPGAPVDPPALLRSATPEV